MKASNVPRADSTHEEWRTASDHRYEVSNCGRIRRVAPGKATHVGKVLKSYPDPMGYLRADLCGRCVHVAHEVARAFIGPRPAGLHINHKNAVKQDNRPENLEYVTPAENVRHAASMSLIPKGESHVHARLSEREVRAMVRLNRQGVGNRRLARKFGVSRSTAYRVISGEGWRHVTRLFKQTSRERARARRAREGQP